jgi:hypothetical protein
VATITQLASGNWRVQVRHKTRYVADTFRRRKDGEEWALEMERNIDRNVVQATRVANLLPLPRTEHRQPLGCVATKLKCPLLCKVKMSLGSF